MHASVGLLDFFHVRWTKTLNLVEPMGMGTRTWSFSVVISKYSIELLAKLHDAAGAVRHKVAKVQAAVT